MIGSVVSIVGARHTDGQKDVQNYYIVVSRSALRAVLTRDKNCGMEGMRASYGDTSPS